MTKTFEAGQAVYARDGRQAEYVAVAVGAGHVVRLGTVALYGDEERTYFDQVAVLDEVFAEAPTALVAAEVAELTVKANALSEQVSEFRVELERREAESNAMLARCAAREKLRDLDNYLAGRMTHFVMVNGSRVRILERGEALADGDGWDTKWSQSQKLLCLFGDTKGDIAWKINQYKDGSGSWSECYPACSIEEATATAARLLEITYAEVRNGKSPWYAAAAVQSADAIGLIAPEDIRKVARESNLAEARRRAKDANESKGTSLGIVEPQELRGCEVKPRDERERTEWETTERQMTSQGRLFGPGVRKIDFPDQVFYVKWTCNDARCSGHEMSFHDWSLHELSRKLNRDSDRVNKVRAKMEQMLNQKKRDLYLMLGNFRGRTYQFGLMGVLSVPHTQARLF